MLSERQIQAVIHEINEDVDIPFASEAREGRIIEKYVRRILPHVGPALEVVCGQTYADAIKTALDDKSPLKNRRKEISNCLKGELSAPLARSVNTHFDAALLTEAMEDQLLRFVIDRILSQFVTWVIGELDDKVEQSLAEAAELAAQRAKSERAGPLPPSDAELLLSDRQVRAMVIEINEDVNLPFVGEKQEGALIATFVHDINPRLVPALNSLCGTIYTTAIRTALDERATLADRREKIDDLLRGALSEPLARELNTHVDSSLLPERMEGKVLRKAVDKMISQCVKLVVSEIDERIEESLAKA